MEAKQLKINIKQAADKKFELQVSEKSTILQIKEECAKNVGCKANEIKLIYKGSYFLQYPSLTFFFRKDSERHRHSPRFEGR